MMEGKQTKKNCTLLLHFWTSDQRRSLRQDCLGRLVGRHPSHCNFKAEVKRLLKISWFLLFSWENKMTWFHSALHIARFHVGTIKQTTNLISNWTLGSTCAVVHSSAVTSDEEVCGFNFLFTCSVLSFAHGTSPTHSKGISFQIVSVGCESIFASVARWQTKQGITMIWNNVRDNAFAYTERMCCLRLILHKRC